MSGRKKRGASPTYALGLCAATVALAMACGGTVEPKLPPPDYVEPKLPPWQPPSATEDDGLEDALAGGEWVEDESQGLGGAPAQPQESQE